MTPPPPRSTLFPYTTLFRSLSGPRRAPPVRRKWRIREPSASIHAQPGPSWPARTSSQAENPDDQRGFGDRKSTRLNSSHVEISYAVFCLKKKIIGEGGRAWG